MTKVTFVNGKQVSYGFNGEKLRNYRQYGLYVKDDDPRLQPPRRWWTSLTSIFR